MDLIIRDKHTRFNIFIDNNEYVLNVDYCFITEEYHLSILNNINDIVLTRQPLVKGYNLVEGANIKIKTLTYDMGIITYE